MLEESENECVFCGCESTTQSPTDFSTESKVIQKFTQQIGVPLLSSASWEEMSFCGDCLSGVVNAVRWREQVGEVERDVRSLQRIILKMMRQLKNIQANYLEEMKSLERKIRSSKEEKSSSCGNTAKAEVFREGVLNVVAELDGFHDDLYVKVESHVQADIIPLKSESQVNSESSTKHERVPSPAVASISFKVEDTTYSPPDPVCPADLMVMDNVDLNVDNPVECETLLMEVEVTGDSLMTPDMPLTSSLSMCSSGSTADHNAHSYTPAAEELPFQCELCPKSFRHLRSLQRHERNHSGTKPFKCSTCKKEFGRSDVLERHQREHVGEKPYPCLLCGTRFPRKDHLKVHVLRHHPGAMGISQNT